MEIEGLAGLIWKECKLEIRSGLQVSAFCCQLSRDDSYLKLIRLPTVVYLNIVIISDLDVFICYELKIYCELSSGGNGGMSQMALFIAF